MSTPLQPPRRGARTLDGAFVDMPWVYRLLVVPGNGNMAELDQAENYLNALAAEGYELAGMAGNVLVMRWDDAE